MSVAQMLTTEEVAATLRRGNDWVTRQCASGGLKAVKVGGAWRIKPEWLDEFTTPGTSTPAARPDRRSKRQKREALRAS